MSGIDSNVLEEYRKSKGTRRRKIDLSELPTGSRIKVVCEDAIPFFLKIVSPREGRVSVICDSGEKEVREDIQNADLGQRLIYCFSGGIVTPSRSSIEEGGQLWFDTFLCFWVSELFLLE